MAPTKKNSPKKKSTEQTFEGNSSPQCESEAAPASNDTPHPVSAVNNTTNAAFAINHLTSTEISDVLKAAAKAVKESEERAAIDQDKILEVMLAKAEAVLREKRCGAFSYVILAARIFSRDICSYNEAPFNVYFKRKSFLPFNLSVERTATIRNIDTKWRITVREESLLFFKVNKQILLFHPSGNVAYCRGKMCFWGKLFNLVIVAAVGLEVLGLSLKVGRNWGFCGCLRDWILSAGEKLVTHYKELFYKLS